MVSPQTHRAYKGARERGAAGAGGVAADGTAEGLSSMSPDIDGAAAGVLGPSVEDAEAVIVT